ncbi:MAG: hypothetical protein QXQ54_08525 [Thermoplasmata archaeon]
MPEFTNTCGASQEKDRAENANHKYLVGTKLVLTKTGKIQKRFVLTKERA